VLSLDDPYSGSVPFQSLFVYVGTRAQKKRATTIHSLSPAAWEDRLKLTSSHTKPSYWSAS
jgi:hypothetical protein